MTSEQETEIENLKHIHKLELIEKQAENKAIEHQQKMERLALLLEIAKAKSNGLDASNQEGEEEAR